jgi:Glycosyltransferases, probably involved in cell wall biogenesis
VALTAVLLAIVAGSIVYSALTMIAAGKYLAVGQVPDLPGREPPISVLKPLSGAEDELEQNLRSFFTQQYTAYEILFAVRDSGAAVAVVEKLRAAYPAIPVRLIVTGEPPYPNAKVYSLDLMKSAARYDLLVMSDSDIRARPDMLATIAMEFADPQVGVVTCPYRAVPGHSFWSKLEALGMNTQFLGGVLVARMLEGMKFALGPTIAARKSVLDEMGGFDRLKDYLAEDFVMGKFAEELGHRVLLSSSVIEHYIGGHDLATNLKHRLRWARSTRRSRPGRIRGRTVHDAAAAGIAVAGLGPGILASGGGGHFDAGRIGWACAGWVLADRLTARAWWLLPLQDLLAFTIWLAGFFGNHIVWRGHRYLLHPDGRFERA